MTEKLCAEMNPLYFLLSIDSNTFAEAEYKGSLLRNMSSSMFVSKKILFMNAYSRYVPYTRQPNCQEMRPF